MPNLWTIVLAEALAEGVALQRCPSDSGSGGRSREGIPATEGGLHAASHAAAPRVSCYAPIRPPPHPRAPSHRATRHSHALALTERDYRPRRDPIAPPIVTFARAGPTTSADRVRSARAGVTK